MESTYRPPEDLSKLTFSSNDSEQSKGLMSFKDLDESHQRKQKLLSSAPLGGGLFDNKAESSKAATTRASDSDTANALPTSETRPISDRKASIRSVKSARKLFGGGKQSAETASREPMPTTTGALPAGITKSTTSDAAKATSTGQAATSIPAASPTRAPPPVPGAVAAPAALANEASSNGKPSETPLAANTDQAATEDADKTLTGSEVGKDTLDKSAEAEGGASIPTDLEASQTGEQKTATMPMGTAP